MQVIAESTWSWLLYAQGERRWLAVVCGTVGLYEYVIELTPAECVDIAAAGPESLARAIAGNPPAFTARHLPDILQTAAADAAIRAWRSRPSNRPQ